MPITFVNYPFLNILGIIVLNIVVKVNNDNNHMCIMNVISSELLQMIMQSTIIPKSIW
jgi:hypothetical protein